MCYLKNDENDHGSIPIWKVIEKFFPINVRSFSPPEEMYLLRRILLKEPAEIGRTLEFTVCM